MLHCCSVMMKPSMTLHSLDSCYNGNRFRRTKINLSKCCSLQKMDRWKVSIFIRSSFSAYFSITYTMGKKKVSLNLVQNHPLNQKFFSLLIKIPYGRIAWGSSKCNMESSPFEFLQVV